MRNLQKSTFGKRRGGLWTVTFGEYRGAAGGRAHLLAVSVMIAGDGRAPTAYARPRFIYIYASGERTR